MMLEASRNGAAVIVLPEIFTCPYNKDEKLKNREPANESGEAFRMLAKVAKKTGKYIIGGSIPEQIKGNDKQIYNTCLCFDPSGKLAAKHQKLHMFDVNLPGQTTYRESDYVKPGKP